jgi:hypothetical protein
MSVGYIYSVSDGVDANLSTFPFKPNAHGRHLKEERKEIRIVNFSLDGSSHQSGDAAFTPPRPMT